MKVHTAVPAPAWRALLPGAWREMDRVRRHVSANLMDAALASGTLNRVVQEAFAPVYLDSGDRWHELAEGSRGCSA